MKRRYLRQQADLGGSEVVLTGALGVGRSASGADRDPAPELATPGAADRPESSVVTPRDQRLTPEAQRPTPHWRTNAPPIPGPGIVIPVPAIDLLAATTLPIWDSLEAVAETIRGCPKCFLAQGRTKTVPGEGNPTAQLMLVGEGPGQTEDQTGRPFVGKAGELLNGILSAIELARDQVFIANIVKCRPPQNRKPLPDEIAACLPYLEAQIGLVRPKVLIALGATAAESLLGVKRSLTDLRGKVHSYRGIPLVVTYHPAALLRNPNWKKPTWDDVRIARQLLDR